MNKVFSHHVFFWLHNAGNKADRDKLIEGLNSLTGINTIREFHIGLPADTRRDVIDSSYDVSWLLFFKTAEDQEKYQKDPVHLKFVKGYSRLWSKVTVYDSIDMS
ncbi:MAG: Dabb family protein [Bacteroidetes bacterium]|nr:Dabb family protein [Bacteroidota bacterium]